MRRTVFTLAIAFAFVCSGGFVQLVASADEAPAAYHGKSVRQVCCRGRCSGVCLDRLAFHPLYGAYGPYGGVGYWGAYTFSGWGYRK
jgi:hypothetical protein